jgi:hypothetical protein
VQDAYFYIFQTREDRDKALCNGLEMAISKKPLYVPQWSSFALGRKYDVRSFDEEIVGNMDGVWKRPNAFKREEPNLVRVLEIGRIIDVEAVPMICSRDGPGYSEIVDLFLIDIGSGKVFFETTQASSRNGLADSDIRDGLIKLFASME